MKQSSIKNGYYYTPMQFLRRTPILLAGLMALSLVPALAPSQATPPPSNSAAAPTAPKALDAATKKSVLDAMERTINTMAFVPNVDFSKWNEFVAAEKANIDKATSENDFAAAVNRALNNFGFSHITLFPPSFGQQRLTQRRAGIGIRIQIEDTGLRVVSVLKETPAEEAGIRMGDLIVESDGKKVRSTADLAGELGQTSRIKLIRDGKDITLEVTRAEYSTVIPESIEWKADKKAAVVTIPTFDQGYSRANVDSLMKQAMSADLLILDLRSNGGGLVLNLQHLMSYFLDRETQPLGTFLGKRTVEDYEKSTGQKATDLVKVAEKTTAKVRPFKAEGPLFKGKVAVLVNGATGSASEMAAAALRDHRNAQVIGSKTAGAVLASMMLPLRDGGGFWMQFPVTDYVTIKGIRLEGNGVTPDMEAEMPRFGETDQAIAKALAILGDAARVPNTNP